jgi:hypothetical protein
MQFPRLALLPLLALLAGCQATVEARVASLVETGAAPAKFDVCHGSGCRVRTAVSLTAEQWARVRAEFAEDRDAPEERARIADVIGLMERLVAKPAGTARDVGRNLIAADQSTQLDCVDEAVNSTTYLRMIDADGLLRFHAVEWPAHRGGMLHAHNTAVVRETATGERYAVDSWFFDNGVPPAVLALEVWRNGWQPGDSIPDVAGAPALPAPVVATCRCGGGFRPEEFTVAP